MVFSTPLVNYSVPLTYNTGACAALDVSTTQLPVPHPDMSTLWGLSELHLDVSNLQGQVLLNDLFDWLSRLTQFPFFALVVLENRFENIFLILTNRFVSLSKIHNFYKFALLCLENTLIEAFIRFCFDILLPLLGKVV